MQSLENYSTPPGAVKYETSLERKRKFVEEFFTCGELGTAYQRTIDSDIAPNRAKQAAINLIENDKFVRDLMALARKNVVGSVTGLLAEHTSILAELRDEARSEGKFAPAIAAEIARGKALGLYDRVGIANNAERNAEEMTTDDLRSLMESVSRLPSSERMNIARMLAGPNAGLLDEIEGHAVVVSEDTPDPTL